MGNLSALQSLTLRKNNFSGVIPLVSLKNCTELEVLDAAENQFAGNVLTWIGERFSKMKILILRSNNFQGLLPMELCQLSSLQILDLDYNNLSENIPSCINNFSAMVTVDHSVSKDMNYFSFYIDMNYISYYVEHASLVRRGIKYEYSTILNLVRAIDLSKNNISGEIPREVTALKELLSLNLSHNSLTGRIPHNIGAMREIEDIDFSANQLSNEIPESISNLTFLRYLNLTDNKLSGRIPTSTQIQGFEASCFTGNDLCGSPLPKNCTETPEHENGGGKDGDEEEVDWFYVSMALGFVVGFCGLLSPLLISRRWRYIYCGFLNRLEDKIYIAARKYY
ncbi:hypothetical protein ACOSQ2_030761 [Xanthoceras sorbifolium]